MTCKTCTPEIREFDSADLLWKPVSADVRAEDIINAVCHYFNVRKFNLFSKTRTRRIVQPRQIAMYLLRYYTDLTLTEIGQIFGGRDHTTVVHACKLVPNLMETDDEYEADVVKLTKII